MSDTRLTPHGIPKLTRLQGKFCECDVIVQVWLGPACPADGDEPTQTYDAIVSDANYYFPAIVDGVGGRLLPGVNIVRVTSALCCFFSVGRDALVINRFQRFLNLDIPAPHFPPHLWLPEPGASRGNPLPLAALAYFPTELELIPRMRVLVTYKSLIDDPRDGRFESGFLVHLLDESDEVRAYAKNQVAFDIYDQLEVGKVYYITNLGKHGRCNEFLFNLQNPNSLKLTRFTVIEECHGSSVPKLRFNFAPLSQIHGYIVNDKSLNQFTCADVIGIVQTVGSLRMVPTLSNTWLAPGKEVPKRDLVISDQLGQTLVVMLWSYNAENFRAVPGTIVAFRHARYLEKWDEFPLFQTLPTTRHVSSSHLTSGSESQHLLSVMSTSTVHVEPEVEECLALRQWYISKAQLLAASNPQTPENTSFCEPCP